jgi:hypothetical protein
MRHAAIVLAAVALAGCGSDTADDAATATSSASAGAPAPGGGLTVSEAIASDLEGPLLVRGYLLERDGELRLCEAILESQPPQCGEPSLRVEGDAPEPSQRQVSVLGDVADGVIGVDDTTAG